ncbi:MULTISPECIES: HNH endonuclease [unclassified Haladaptatus]|uniref:HNH endonuclease n=1 Tax=unclassified Haladaptatus TaxID=2622732 RepID=UPI00209BE160|nr:MULTISPECIES: HNH endonuclease [unclassified Haladaptatus]MCO8244042.1 HNH endonuclease [Haladaptatus sp. AB643]MCO8255847.1 HNH endonuclease [Haladaptatus sp. AB618]
MVGCPTCNKSFDSQQGVRIHHTHKHGESLPNRTCKGCGKQFYDEKARKQFCQSCSPNAAENNGNWRGGRVITECHECGSEFSYYPSNKKGIYCSDCIQKATGLLPENPSKKGKRIETECLYCHEQMIVRPSRNKGRSRGIFCDMGCYGSWLSENIVGENHHQWEDSTINYTGRWWRIRQQALERDARTCQQCGKTESEIGQTPDVHHIIRLREFDNPQEAHRLDNVITLCRSCHRNVEEGNTTLPN